MLTAWFYIHIICIFLAPVAQLDRVSGYEPEGRAFESLRVRQRKFILSAPIVQRLGHRPFTAVTGVRFPVGVPDFNKPLLKNSKGLFLSLKINELYSVLLC